MRVGVISDTHGNLGAFLDCIDFLRRRHEVAKVFFLGHDYEDFDRLLELKQALRETSKKGRNRGDNDDFVGDLYEVLAKQQGIPTKRTRELDDVSWLKKNVVRICGKDEPAAAFGHTPTTEFEVVAGRIVLATHNPKSLTKEDIASANLVLYGHTHLFQADKVGGRYFLNPGHLSDKDGEERPPTCGLLNLGDDPVFAVLGIDGSEVKRFPLELEKKRKFSAG